MSNVVSFNLLKFVERKPVLSAKVILIIVVAFCVVLLSYMGFKWARMAALEKVMTAEELTVQQSASALQSLVHPSSDNSLVGITTFSLIEARQDFSAQFEALSHIHILGLWLSEVIISRNPEAIEIRGGTDSTEKLNMLLQQLTQQPIFNNTQFKVIDVHPELFKDVPKADQDELKQLKLPTFYHFTVHATRSQLSEKI